MKNLTLALAFTIVFTFTGIGSAAVPSTRILNAQPSVQPQSCLIEVDRQAGEGWELVEQIDVGAVNLLNDYTIIVSVEPNMEYMMRCTVDDLEPCVTGPFEEKRATGVCVR